jgi:hypothetical protein
MPLTAKLNKYKTTKMPSQTSPPDGDIAAKTAVI